VSISSTYYARVFCQYLFAKKSQRRSAIREKLQNLLSYEKRVSKMLVKLTPGDKFDLKKLASHQTGNFLKHLCVQNFAVFSILPQK